jgi:hypothetical protein
LNLRRAECRRDQLKRLPSTLGWGAENDRWRDSLTLNVLGHGPGGAQAARSQRPLAVVLVGIGPARLSVAKQVDEPVQYLLGALQLKFEASC